MCTTPPSPPPPPPPPCPSGEHSPKSYNSSPTLSYSDVCEWASHEPQLWEVCAKNSLCLQEAPFQYKYKHFESIMQIGPTCGLVALSMLLRGEVSPEELLNITKMEGYSNNGEMFSCKDMGRLAEKAISLAELDNINFSVKTGSLFSEEIILELLNGAAILVALNMDLASYEAPSTHLGIAPADFEHPGFIVYFLNQFLIPFLIQTAYYQNHTGLRGHSGTNVYGSYDADFNHSPCLRNGHTAHWALVCGVIVVSNPGESYISNPNNVYVLCRHGKSRFLAAWTLDELDKSNKNLWEFSPKKQEDGLLYVLPEGGMGGENGLRDQFLIFYGV